MKKLTILTIISLFLSLQLLAQAGFQVSPGKLFFRQQAGQQASQNVIVMNSSAQRVVVRCSFSDWRRDSVGDKKYAPAGSMLQGNASYLKVIPEILTLEPGEKKSVEVIMNLPEGKDTSVTNAMLFITQVDEKKAADKGEKKEAFMKFLLEMGVHVYNEPPHLQFKNVDIESVKFISKYDTTIEFNKKIQRLDTTIRLRQEIVGWIKNTGDLIAEGTVRYELTEKATGKELKLEAVPFNSLPNDRLIAIRPIPKNTPTGKYTLIMLVDIGMDLPLKVGEAEIVIK